MAKKSQSDQPQVTLLDPAKLETEEGLDQAYQEIMRMAGEPPQE